jgi:tetratricopeptide (TPR) repeat protein/thiol-disulfide isomerase/thioredoxin
VWWVGVALAGEIELEIERGRVAYELERYADARNHAIDALRSMPASAEAQQLYVDATTAAGLGSRGLFELVAFETTSSPYFADGVALEQAVADGEWKTIRTATEQIVVQWPTAPDLLAPLWQAEGSKVTRARDRLLGALVSPEALGASDVERLYRLRRLLVEIGAAEERKQVEQVLVDRGEPQPAARPPYDRFARADVALQVSKEPLPDLPWGYPGELVDVALRLEDLWGKAKRWRHVALAWQQVQEHTDDPTAWTHEAQAWLEEKESEKAITAVETALVRATAARNTDLIARNEDRQRVDLAQALLVRARVAEHEGDLVAAYGDYATATLLAGKTLDDGLGERLERASAAAWGLLGRTYTGAVPAEAALAQALKAADQPAALQHARDARFLAAKDTRGAKLVAEAPELYADLFARSFQAEVAAERARGRIDGARVSIVLSTLLIGPDKPFWWVTRAELQEQSGEYDAAFASYAVARGLGVRELDDHLQRVYVGVADWELGANNLGGPPPEVAAVVQTDTRPQAPRPRPASHRPSTAPELGKSFPSFSVDTGSGSLTNSALAGRVYVLTFWRADCSSCLQTLRDFGHLARVLRNEGRDVRVLGVSLDGDQERYEEVWQRANDWCELAWAPQLAGRFGVTAFPSTWVVDSRGVARHYVDHWLSAEDLEALIRRVE